MRVRAGGRGGSNLFSKGIFIFAFFVKEKSASFLSWGEGGGPYEKTSR